MDSESFRVHGKNMVDYIADYWTTIRERNPLPEVKPGDVWRSLPPLVPNESEPWDKIFADIDQSVTNANTHWMHPNFYAYYPSANSGPSIIGDMLCCAISGLGLNWESSPVSAELELVVADWLAKSIGLPEQLHNFGPGNGGGMIVGTASEGTLTALLTARKVATKKYGDAIIPKLVAYCSDQAHSSVERAALLGGVQMRILQTTKNDLYGLNAETFLSAIQQDLKDGLKPFFLCATVGTTSSCAIDHVQNLVQACDVHEIWMHVDAAYAASAAICPEHQYLLQGVQTCELAEKFANLVSKDDNFEMFVPVRLGLACFTLKRSNADNEALMQKINEDRRIHLVPSKIHGTFFLRLAVCSPYTTEKDIELAWNVISELAETLV